MLNWLIILSARASALGRIVRAIGLAVAAG
jgi:hypothetical protein